MLSQIKNNLFFISQLLLVCFLFFLAGCQPFHNDTAPAGLMTDLLLHPEEAVITNPSPKFSWIVNGPDNGVMQTAYQILVASDLKFIEDGNPDVWDSGKVDSDESIAVPYRGGGLDENRSYWWKVRTWDQNGEVSAYSTPQRFNTGDFYSVERSWPGESRWVQLKTNDEKEHVFENRHPVRYHDIPPVSVVNNSLGNHFISFEEAYFATLKIKFDQTIDNADTLVIHLGEKLAPGNQVDRDPGGSIIYKKEKLVLQPGKSEYLVELPRQHLRYPNSQVLAEHLPEVTAFRYAEIEGWPGTLTTDQVWQHALLYHFDDKASDFYSSDDNLNQIWDLCKHTLKVAPFMGIYVDNGTRERMPYEADAHMQQVSHYAVDREFAIQRYTTNFLIFNPSWPTEWHLHIVPMAWSDYMATGNTDFLEKYYDELKKKTLLPLAREDGLISTRTGLVTEEFLESIHYHGTSFRDIVDWPQGTPADETELRSGHGSVTFEGETDRYIFSDINTVVNAFHYRNLVLMAKIAGVLDKNEDERFFNERSELVRASINEKLLDNETGLYRDGEGVDHSAFHASMFPVAFGIAPEENYSQIRDFLISKGMACSPIMVRYLFDALYELGAEDYALELLTSETDRSWMNMIRFGSTGVAEAWDMKYKRNLAWIQPTGSTPTYIIPRKIFGIEPIESSFRKILISPRPGALESAKIKHPTIRGSINMKFINDEDVFSVDVTLPGNTRSDICLPNKFANYNLLCNGEPIEGKELNERILIQDVSPGHYLFEIRKN